MSSALIFEYRTKFISKEILRQKLEELSELADEAKISTTLRAVKVKGLNVYISN